MHAHPLRGMRINVLPSSSRRQATLIRVAFYLSNLLCVLTIKKDHLLVVFPYGGLEEIRTPDPHNANVVRSQLRYKPVISCLL